MFQIPTTAELETACEAMPLFPLPGAVFLPHTMLPLHVFEERYRDLIEDTLAADGYLAIPRLRPGWEAAASKSNPGKTVYRNLYTREKPVTERSQVSMMAL